MNDDNRATDEACEELLRHIFGNMDELMAEIAPEGWASSPYARIHNPTPEQMYRERVTMHKNMARLFAKSEKPQLPPPTLEEIQKEHGEADHTPDPAKELPDVLGGCLWSVFSNNHEVIGGNGEEYDLGSFRGTGSFLAEFIEKHYPDAPAFNYMDFYCADAFIERRADVTPIYELIFRRLKARGCDWNYAFPQLHVIDFSSAKEQLAPSSPEDYDPNAALAAELEKEKKQAELRKLREELDEAHQKAKEEALYKPPPMVVRAYQNVYGQFPKGWVREL